jgi:hypothetical protein
MARKLVTLPRFTNEAAEADWHNSSDGVRYSEQVTDAALKAGAFVRGPVTRESLAALDEATEMMRLKPISIRIPERDLAEARALAEQAGVGYQLVLKRAIRAGLDSIARTQSKRKSSHRQGQNGKRVVSATG